MKKQGNQVAIAKSADLAAVAWSRLESAAAKELNGDAASMRMYADTNGITLHATDSHGTQILIQNGKISAKIAGQDPA